MKKLICSLVLASGGLFITALLPTKVNAVSLSVSPPLGPFGDAGRDRGSFIQFRVSLGREPSNPNPLIFRALRYTYDENELFLRQESILFEENDIIDRTIRTTIALFNFNVTNPIEDYQSDLSVEVDFQEGDVLRTYTVRGADVYPVPEPLTILGAATALGYGAILKRKSSKKTVS